VGSTLGVPLGEELGTLLMCGARLMLEEALTLGLVLGLALGEELEAVIGEWLRTLLLLWTRLMLVEEETGSWQVLTRSCVGSTMTQLLLQHCASLKHLWPRVWRRHSAPSVNCKLCGD
jgi:hypothetical protein